VRAGDLPAGPHHRREPASAAAAARSARRDPHPRRRLVGHLPALAQGQGTALGRPAVPSRPSPRSRHVITSALPRYCADFLRDGTKSLLVDGRWIPGSGEPFETSDPATGVPLATLASAGAGEVDTAIAAARHALQNEWASCTPAARARVLWRIAEAIDAHADELAELETLDQGKSWATSRFAEIPSAAEQFRYYAGWATKITGTTVTPSITYAPPGRKVVAHSVREPVGVVAAIVPWHSPLLRAALKPAPARGAGCTVVLQPAEDTSLTARRFGDLLAESGIPDGVVNILTGGGEVGRMLAEHAGVDKVTFTGSTEVGKKLV